MTVRIYRAPGVDLQRAVHEDMKADFHLYPKKRGLKRPDTNIDHRRVADLQVFFSGHGKEIAVTKDPNAYKAGDVVIWNLTPGGDFPHTGIVTDQKSESGNPLTVHNPGQGPQLEDILFACGVTGHYRYETK